MIMIMQQMIHIQFYTLVAWKFATSMGILISLLVGFLIMIPIMACDHPTLPIQTAFGSYPEVGSRWHSWHRKGSAVMGTMSLTGSGNIDRLLGEFELYTPRALI